jgi:4-hydroxymandelate oxidase
VDFGTLRMLGVLTGEMPADARLDRIPLTWDDVARLRSRIDVPLVVKGVLRPEDARRCVDVGVDGVVVSNHGGRQLDGVLPALYALATIAERVGTECVVLLDGGIRNGADVVRALALGARAVCIGRPYLWGLRLAGQAGVEAVVELLRAEIEDTLSQLGLASVTEVTRDCVVLANDPK